MIGVRLSLFGSARSGSGEPAPVETIVRTARGTAAGTGTTLTKTGVSVAAGSYLFVLIGVTNNQNALLMTDAAGILLNGVGGFSLAPIGEELDQYPDCRSFSYSKTFLAYRYCSSALTNVSLAVTFTNDGEDAGVSPTCMILTQVAGLALSGAFDLAVGEDGLSTTPSSGATGTPTQDHEFVLGMVGGDGTAPQSAGTWTSPLLNGQYVESIWDDESPAVYISLSEAFYIQTAAAARTAAKTGLANQYWGAVVTTFKAAA